MAREDAEYCNPSATEAQRLVRREDWPEDVEGQAGGGVLSPWGSCLGRILPSWRSVRLASRLLGHWVRVRSQGSLRDGCVAVTIFQTQKGRLRVVRFNRGDKLQAVKHATPTPTGCWIKDGYTRAVLRDASSREMDGLVLHVRSGGAANDDQPEEEMAHTSSRMSSHPSMRITSQISVGALHFKRETTMDGFCDCLESHGVDRPKQASFRTRTFFDGDDGDDEKTISWDSFEEPSPVPQSKYSHCERCGAVWELLSPPSQCCGMDVQSTAGPDTSRFMLAVGVALVLSALLGMAACIHALIAWNCPFGDRYQHLHHTCVPYGKDWNDTGTGELAFWVVASATMAAFCLSPQRMRMWGDFFAAQYMSLCDKEYQFASGTAGIQMGGVMHQIGGRATMLLVVLLLMSGAVQIIWNAAYWSDNLFGFTPAHEYVETLDHDRELHSFLTDKLKIGEWCTGWGFVPSPFLFILARLVLGSVLQDFFFGSGGLMKRMKSWCCSEDAEKVELTLYQELEKPVPLLAKSFFLWQMISMLVAYWRCCEFFLSTEQPAPSFVTSSGSYLGKYVWAVYTMAQQGAVISVCQLLAKLFVEVNVDVDGTAKELFHAVNGTGWNFPAVRSSEKSILMWVAAFAVLPFVLVSIPFIFISYLYIFYAATFPIWGALLWVLLLFEIDPLLSLLAQPDMPRAIDFWQDGLQAHVTLWGYWALLLALVAAAIHIRINIWAGLARTRGFPQHGKCGYLTLITNVFWTGALVALLQSFVAWGSLLWALNGDRNTMSEIAMLEFNSRQVVLYGECVAEQVSKWPRQPELFLKNGLESKLGADCMSILLAGLSLVVWFLCSCAQACR